MNKKTKMILSFAGFAVFILLASFLYNNLEAVAEGPLQQIAKEPGTVSEPTDAGENSEPERALAPDFTAFDSEGNEVKLSDLRGKPVVLNFWASWCPPCKSEMPTFNKIAEEMGEDVTFMMVDMVDGQRETQEKGASYVEKQGFTFPVYYDTEQQAAYTYGVSSIPMTLFIDKEGYLVAGVRGPLDEENLRTGIGFITSAPVTSGNE